MSESKNKTRGQPIPDDVWQKMLERCCLRVFGYTAISKCAAFQRAGK